MEIASLTQRPLVSLIRTYVEDVSESHAIPQADRVSLVILAVSWRQTGSLPPHVG
jgi:hypothetical protein